MEDDRAGRNPTDEEPGEEHAIPTLRAGESGDSGEPPPAYAGVVRRFLATVIDLVVLGAFYWLAAWLTGNLPTDGFRFPIWFVLLAIAIFFCYYVVLEGLTGRTIGKAALRIRVVCRDGGRLNWGRTVVRNVMRFIDGVPYIFLYLLAAILVWSSDESQRLGDMAAGAIVVRY